MPSFRTTRSAWWSATITLAIKTALINRNARRVDLRGLLGRRDRQRRLQRRAGVRRSEAVARNEGGVSCHGGICVGTQTLGGLPLVAINESKPGLALQIGQGKIRIWRHHHPTKRGAVNID
jgi:hypothetical protein